MRMRSLLPPSIALITGMVPLPAAEIHGTIRSDVLPSMRDVVVYLEGEGLPVKVPKEPGVVDQKNIRFVPHLLPVVVGSTVNFPNSDETPHNVYSSSEAKTFNLGTYPKGESRSIEFDKPGIVELLCNVHQEMDGFIIVMPSSIYARPANDGTYVLKDVPPGKYRVVAVHPELDPVSREVEVPSAKAIDLTLE